MHNHEAKERISRRRFLRLTLGGIASMGALGIGASAYATRVEPYRLTITRLTIPLAHLSPLFAGFTIAQISDLHFGSWMTLEWMLNVVDQVNALAPDLIAVTGDFVSALGGDIPDQISRALSALRARDGVVAVLGNHDYWTYAPTVRRAVREAGALLLDNTHLALQRSPAALYIAGVDDIWEAQDDLSKALRGVPDRAATVLLAHEPDYADRSARTGRIGLQLSGHSHGGQVRLPGYGAPILPRLGQKYDMGAYQIGEMALYVNRGIGMTAPHVRLNCPPEITLLTLVPGNPTA